MLFRKTERAENPLDGCYSETGDSGKPGCEKVLGVGVGGRSRPGVCVQGAGERAVSMLERRRGRGGSQEAAPNRQVMRCVL